MGEKLHPGCVTIESLATTSECNEETSMVLNELACLAENSTTQI